MPKYEKSIPLRKVRYGRSLFPTHIYVGGSVSWTSLYVCFVVPIYVSTRYLPRTPAGKPAIRCGLYSSHLIVPVHCRRKRNHRITREKPSCWEHHVAISHRTMNMSLKCNAFPDFWRPDNLHSLGGGYQAFTEIWVMQLYSIFCPHSCWIFN
jgi:hypothetical protein